MAEMDNWPLGLINSAPAPFTPPANLPASSGTPIDFLRPQSPQHQFVLEYLMKRIRMSSRSMSKFYPRWQANELRTQAFVHLRDYERLLKDMNDRGEPANPVTITVPYAWSTLQTIVTYLLHMFAGRKPIFTIGANSGEQVAKAKNMETLLQYNADYTKLVRALHQFLLDGENYGVAIFRTQWRKDVRVREIVAPPTPELSMMMSSMGMAAQGTRQRQPYVCFEGNTIATVDPYMFLPDPRVPMAEVNEKGEFVFWRTYMGRHLLLREEGLGRLKWVKEAPAEMAGHWYGDMDTSQSFRARRAMGDSQPGSARWDNGDIGANMQVDQGSVEIIPAELGLGAGKVPEKWMFSIVNEGQIVQAQPLNLNHGRHPVEVSEPNTMGYAFGQLGTTDFLGPLQDLQSWFFNSHIYNVRSTLNNSLIVDPSKVEMQDLKRPEPGKLIRLKSSGIGPNDPRMAVMQLQMQDVTRGHMDDAQTFSRMADNITGASDNLRGIGEFGGRKTATEVRTVADAGASRLAAKGMLISAQAMTGLAEQWAMNYQQNLDHEFEVSVLGADGQSDSVIITPDAIDGAFYYPVHDGTLPLDKVALLQVWQQILTGMIQDPTGTLRSQYSIPKVFEWVAVLGGAQNIRSFRLNPQPDDQVANQVQAGNLVPAPGQAPQVSAPQIETRLPEFLGVGAR